MQNVSVTQKGKKGTVPARLFMIFARRSPTAVIFRRGPSKWVQLIKWNTATDLFESGQWFNGRIYERRSDLSPDGSLLIYFAQKISARSMQDAEYTYAWTAISRPPFLTALALWPKGDCWHGGGLSRQPEIVAEVGITEVEFCGFPATLHGFPFRIASLSGGAFQAARSRFHPATVASTVATSACAALRNSSPEHHVNVWMFSDGQPDHLYSTIFLFGF